MVYTCYICKWRADKKQPRSFHKFPTDESEKIQWLKIMGKSDERLSSRAVVCSLHFNKDCFRYGPVEGRAFLNKGSFPMLHNLTSESAETSHKLEASPSLMKIKSELSADGINFYDSSPTSSITPTIEGSINCEKTMGRIDDVIQDHPKKKSCLDQPVECGLRELYLVKELKEKMKEILFLKRQNRQLRKSQSKMKGRMQQLKKEHKAEKKLMNVRILIAKKKSKSNFL